MNAEQYEAAMRESKSKDIDILMELPSDEPVPGVDGTLPDPGVVGTPGTVLPSGAAVGEEAADKKIVQS
ncbi:hypothetical protein LINGRAHAP2_LOCUS6635 [Linum grandiflorum]